MAKIKLTKEQRARLKRMADQGLIAYNPKRVGGETKVQGKKAGGQLTTQEVDRLRKLDLRERTKQAFGPSRRMRKAAPKRDLPRSKDEKKLEGKQFGMGSPIPGYTRGRATAVMPSEREQSAQRIREDEERRESEALWGALTLAEAGAFVATGGTSTLATAAAKKAIQAGAKRLGVPVKKFAKKFGDWVMDRNVKEEATKRAIPKFRKMAKKGKGAIEFAPAARITGAQAKKLLTKAGVKGVSKMSAAQAVSALKKLKSAKEAAKRVTKKAPTKKKPAAKAKPSKKLNVSGLSTEAKKAKKQLLSRMPKGADGYKEFAKRVGKLNGDELIEAAYMTGRQTSKQAKVITPAKEGVMGVLHSLYNVGGKAAKQVATKSSKKAAKPKATKAPKAPKAAKAPAPKAAPKTAPAKAAAPAEGNLAKQLGYKNANTQKALNTFFRERGVTSLDDAIDKAPQLARALSKIKNSKVSGKGLRKRIDSITTTKQPGMTSARPKPKDARPPVAEEGAKRAAGRMKRARGQMRSERLKAAEAQAPRVQAVKGRVKGIRKIIQDNASGKITPEQAEKSIGTLLSKAPAPLAAEIRRLMRAAQDMGIAARKATGAQLESLKADQGKAVAKLNKLIMSLLVTAGLGASAE